MANNKKHIDWEAIEREYRAGVKTLREIAADHGIAHGSITKRARRLEWDRDLSKKIQIKAEALASKIAAREASKLSSKTLLSDKEIVEVNAQAIAAVDLEHRAGCVRSRNTFKRLQDEFDSLSPDNDPLDKRVNVFAKMINAQESLYNLERKILKLDRQESSTSSLEQYLLSLRDAQ